jgi:dihydroneopterin aldolase
MKFFAYHGVAPEEKVLGQTFEIDIDVSTSLKAAAISDDLSTSIDYSVLFTITKEEMFRHKYDLIETVAEKIARKVLSLNGALSTTIRIRKPNAPIDGVFDHVEIQITRDRV